MAKKIAPADIVEAMDLLKKRLTESGGSKNIARRRG